MTPSSLNPLAFRLILTSSFTEESLGQVGDHRRGDRGQAGHRLHRAGVQQAAEGNPDRGRTTRRRCLKISLAGTSTRIIKCKRNVTDLCLAAAAAVGSNQ